MWLVGVTAGGEEIERKRDSGATVVTPGESGVERIR